MTTGPDSPVVRSIIADREEIRELRERFDTAARSQLPELLQELDVLLGRSRNIEDQLLYPATDATVTEEDPVDLMSVREQGREIDRLVVTLRSTDPVAPELDVGFVALRSSHLRAVENGLLDRLGKRSLSEQEGLVGRYAAIESSVVGPMVGLSV